MEERERDEGFMSTAFIVCCVKEMDGVLGVGRENEKKERLLL